MVLPGSDAAVFLVREANKILAATSDCNALYCAIDPRQWDDTLTEIAAVLSPPEWDVIMLLWERLNPPGCRFKEGCRG